MKRSTGTKDTDRSSWHELSEEEFLAIVDGAPLVSIDLVAVDPGRRMLVGKRNNEPAKGTWFVPGGRIRKDESLDDAFSRIATTELGSGEWDRANAELIGVFNHFYDSNFAESEGTTTHYVVLAYLVDVGSDQNETAPLDQHSKYEWIERSGLVASPPPEVAVHENSKTYLEYLDRPLTATQYPIANARRDGFNSLLWQTPALTMTGLAFVFTILLSTTSNVARLAAAVLAMAISFAALQLMAKHRLHEERLAVALHRYEMLSGSAPLNRKSPPAQSWLTRRKSVRLWKGLFVFFLILAPVTAVALTIWEP